MKDKLKGRNFLTLLDFSAEEIEYLLELSFKLKKAKKNKSEQQYMQKKNIALIFEKKSTKTRSAFEVAAYDQGAHVTYISNGSQIANKETIINTTKVLGKFYDGIEFYGLKQSDIEILAKYAGIPVWNGLSDEYHPTQVLADLLTIKEFITDNLKNVKIVFYGNARNNISKSLMIGAAKMGMHFIGCAPKQLWPDEDLIKICQEIAKSSKAIIELNEKPLLAAKNADVIYTDIWVSMDESDTIWSKRIRLLKPYQVNRKIMAQAKKNSIFLHCLPSFHNKKTKIGKYIGNKFYLSEFEVTAEVFKSEQSKVFHQVENCLHTIKAIMVATIGE